MTHPTALAERPLLPAIKQGFRNRCPACGEAPLFGKFLKPLPQCPSCGQDWSHQRADDLPAYLVILLLGHILAPIIIAASLRFDPPLWMELTLWPMLAAIAALLLIQPAKGAVIALQWARRMHGF